MSSTFRPGNGAPALPRGYAQYENGSKVNIGNDGVWFEDTSKGNKTKLYDATGEWVGEWVNGKKPQYYYGDRKDKERTQWLKGGSGDGFLVWDHNKDGLITDNTELMSEYAKDGSKAFAHGYEKLAFYFDKDKNGIIEGSELNGLNFWVDDGDALTQAGELKSLSEYGITKIVIPDGNETLASQYNYEEAVDKRKKSDAGGSKLSFGGFGDSTSKDDELLRTSSKASSSIDTVLNPPVKEIANLKFSLNIDSSASYTSLTQDPTSVEKTTTSGSSNCL